MTRRRLLVVGFAAVLVLGAVTVMILRAGDDDRPSRLAAGAGSAVSTTTSTPTTTAPSSTTELGPAPSPTSTSVPVTAPTTSKPTPTTLPPRVVAGRLPMLMPLEVVSADTRTAWVVGSNQGTGVFARTDDGGRTWSWQCTGRLLTGVSLIDARRGIVVSGRAGGAPALLYTTVDGGRTFSAREIDVPIDVVSTVDFTDERTGVIAGISLDARTGSTGVIASTRDAGRTWRVRTYPGVEIEDVIERAGEPHIAVGSRGQQPPVVLDLDAPDGTPPVVIDQLTHLRGAVVYDGRLIAVGASQNDAAGLPVGPSMVESRDGGATWTAIASSPPANLHAVSVSPAGELWASGQVAMHASVIVSTDGGASWQTRHTSADGGGFTSLGTAGTSAWALGYQPGLTVAIDSAAPGESWLSVPIGHTPSC